MANCVVSCNIYRGIPTKRPMNNLQGNLKRPFRMSWSQRGHDIYMIFVRTTKQLNFGTFDVALTDRACTIKSPDFDKHGWNFFLEVKAKEAHRVQNNDKLIIVIPKKDPTLCWPSLKRKVDYKDPGQNREILPQQGSDEPPPEKIQHKNKDDKESVSNEMMNVSSSVNSTTASITMATGTMVTNGILKGGNRPLTGATSTHEASSSSGININKEHHSGQCRHLKSIKNDWYESGSDLIVLTLFIANLDPWGVSVAYQEDEIKISFKTGDEKFHNQHSTTSDFTFIWAVKLSGEIDPGKCKHRITLKLLELKLFKKKPQKWESLFDECEFIDNEKRIRKECLSSGDNGSLSCDNTPNSTIETPCNSGSTTFTRWGSSFKLSLSEKSSNKPGFTGLDNIGNTCFMNSVLQALANTTEVKVYFLENHFQKDINFDNPLGMNGKMAEEFAKVVEKLWSGIPHSFPPAKFRLTVGEKESRFVDYMQHDAQEFMAFLLDKVHEDLNRIKDKPYYEIPEIEGRDDHLVATESWKLHISRNDSFIVELFHGMYKSRLTCPVCNKNSTKFDPFLFLSVPLPKTTRPISVIYHSKDVHKMPTKITLNVSKSCGTAMEILNQVSKIMKCPVDSLRMFEIHKNRIYRFFVPGSSIDKILSTDIIFIQETISAADAHEPVYELAVQQRCTVPQVGPECSFCKSVPSDVKIKRCLKCLRTGYCGIQCQKSDWPEHRKVCERLLDPVGFPFITSIPQSAAKLQQIKANLFLQASKYVKVEYMCNDEGDESFHNKDFLFNITSINWDGTTNIDFPQLDEFGDNEVLDLSQMKLVALDWQTDFRLSSYVNVSTKRMEFTKQEPTKCRNSVDLYDCIRLFTEPEVLAPQEAWYCPKCKEHQEATKQMSLWQLPDVLIIQLKRFSFKNYLWRDKIDMFVHFPINGLDMSHYCINNEGKSNIYDLFAVVNHHGGIFGGHYTSYVRLPDLNDTTQSIVDWRVCDDSHVTRISPEQVITKAAYVMFYRRRKVGTVAPEKEMFTSLSNEVEGESDQNSDDLSPSQGQANSSSSHTNNLDSSSTGNKLCENTDMKLSTIYPFKFKAASSGQEKINLQISTNGEDSQEIINSKRLSPDLIGQSDIPYNYDITMDCLTNQPLLKYDEVFKDGNMEPLKTVDSVASSLMTTSSTVDSPTETHLPYTDMDAID